MQVWIHPLIPTPTRLTRRRTRRVKCDEQKPLCRRCVQAGRLCGGYSHQSISSTALQPALRIGATADSQTERLRYLAAHVLSLDNNGHPLREDGVWGRIFLQLSNQVDCVKAAAAAFGAAYEASLHSGIGNSPCSAWRQYGSALAKLRVDFNSGNAGPESLALASMVLACAEILSQHEQNAFAHFLGAVQILTPTSQRREGGPGASFDILNTIRRELVSFEVLIGSYAMSQTPAFMHLEPQGPVVDDHVLREPELAVDTAMLCLHRCYQFIQSTAQLRYKYPSWKGDDPATCNAQSDAVAQCRSMLDGLAEHTTRLQAHSATETSALGHSETLGEIYALRAQLTSTLVYLQCIDNPFQAGYDEHQLHFRNIVSDAAASARLSRRIKLGALKRFSTRPGVVSPLFFVSMRCRDPSLRALATTMLGEQDREGPTDGRIMAAIGARLATLETSASVASFSSVPLAACNVLEEHRVHGYGVSPPRWNSEGRRVVDVQFSRPKVPLSQGWGHRDYLSLENWILWSETILL